jgi:arylsulfatase A-like enzyme
MATSLDLAGVEKPEYVQFNSFKDILNGENTVGHYNGIYGAYMNLQRMIRKDGYKLLVYPTIDKVLLFDLEADPNEMKDLANNSKYTEKVASLFNDLMTLQKTMNDSLDLKDTYKKVVKLP